MIGRVLFICTLVAALTGYPLPWDQKAYWGMTIMSNVMGSAPVIGEKLKFVVLGGTEIGQNALSRAYDIHVKLMPLIISTLIAVHLIRNRADDLTANPGLHGNAADGSWSDIIMREFAKFLLILIVMMGASILFGAPLEEQANPSVTPVPAKAPWFFLGLQELLSWGAPLLVRDCYPECSARFRFSHPVH